MSVTILPYLTDVSQTTTSVSNQPTTSQVAQAERNSTTFKETLDAVMKATAAVAIDNLVKASSTGAVNADIVQEFFNQNGIQITLPNVQNFTNGKEIVKVIAIPNKIVNIVVKG